LLQESFVGGAAFETLRRFSVAGGAEVRDGGGFGLFGAVSLLY
jgi:hypothetical protein